MRRLFLPILIAVGFLAGAALADRTRVLLSSTAQAIDVRLQLLDDGGVRVSSSCVATYADGGTESVSGAEDLVGANLTAAQTLMAGRALTVCRNASGL